MIFLQLFWEFFKTGLFAVGGGMATVPFLFEMGTKTGWFSYAQLADMIAVSESTPGPIGINMATYVGYQVAGLAGGITATLGLVAPSVIIIVLIAKLFERFSEAPAVKTVFKYLRAAVTGLIGFALWRVASITLFEGGQILLIQSAAYLVFLGCALYFRKVHPAVWIAVGAVFGILFL